MIEPLRHQLTIRAPAQIVYELLTTAEGLADWMGVEARADPHEGGRIWWRHANGDACSGTFIELRPYTRIVFTYGWERPDVGIPPGSTVVEIDLDERGGITTIRLTHRGLSDPARLAHAEGWPHYLDRLAVRATGHDPGPDQWAHLRVPSFL